MSYDQHKLATPPGDEEGDLLADRMVDAETAAQELADLPEIDEDLPADVDEDGVYIEVTCRFRVRADDLKQIRFELYTELLDLGRRLWE